ncbi:MAG: type IX secretion system membrane protein PorP/SprF [Bacteroidota bacterium]
MKNILTILCLLLTAGIIRAQQLPLSTQFEENRNLLNPASCGIKTGLLQAGALYRYQWLNMDNAPRTAGFNATMNFGTMGAGLVFISDKAGIYDQKLIHGQYAYCIPLNENDLNLSFGISAGAIISGISAADITVYDPSDPLVLNQQLKNTTIPDANVGAMIFKQDKFYAGLSAMHLVEAKLNKNIAGTLAGHYYMIGGATIPTSETFSIQPSLMMRYVSKAPVLAEIQTRALLKKMYSFGLMYRTCNDLGFNIGLNIGKNVFFGYAYELSLSPLKSYHNNTHELTLFYKLQKDNSSTDSNSPSN